MRYPDWERGMELTRAWWGLPVEESVAPNPFLKPLTSFGKSPGAFLDRRCSKFTNLNIRPSKCDLASDCARCDGVP